LAPPPASRLPHLFFSQISFPPVLIWFFRILAREDFKTPFPGKQTPAKSSLHEIENCGLVFPRLGEFPVDDKDVEWEFKCPILWENLQDALIQR
jgi:hypothetical protein